MHYDGTFRQTYINNQGICDEVWYSILKEDYFKEKDIWDVLYNKALGVLNPVHYNSFVDAGGVASAIQTIDGNIYLGVCIDTCSGLGMCAERNAIGNMLTYGENKIKRIVEIMRDKKVGSPCGACREMLMQLDPSNQDLEILVDIETKEITKEEINTLKEAQNPLEEEDIEEIPEEEDGEPEEETQEKERDSRQNKKLLHKRK